METPNRVSALIETLEQNIDRPSRASWSRSPSQTPYVVTPEKPRSPSLRGDITSDGTTQEDPLRGASVGSNHLTPGTMEDEKEVAVQSEARAEIDAILSRPHRPPTVQLCEEHLQSNEHNYSGASSERSDSSFVSPFVLTKQDQEHAVPFDRPVSLWDQSDWQGEIYPPGTNRLSTTVPHFEVPLASALHSHPPDPKSFLRRSATMPPRRPTSFVPIPLDTTRTHHWGTEDVLGTPYPGRGDASVMMPEAPESTLGPLRGTIRKQSKQKGEASATDAVLQNREASNAKRLNLSKPKEDSLLVSVRDSATGAVRYVPLFIPRQGLATGQPGHDDEELAFRLRDSYLALRGPWKTLFVARSIVGVSIQPNHSSPNQTCTPARSDRSIAGNLLDAEKGNSASPRSNRRPQVQRTTSSRLLSLFHNPSQGREKSRLVQAVGDAARTDASLRLVEGWSFSRVSLAVGIILLASIAATLFWTLFGSGERAHIELLNAASANAATSGNSTSPIPVRIISRTSRVLSSLPADRVEPAAVLGGLILFLGWTGVGAWMFLSYLVT